MEYIFNDSVIFNESGGLRFKHKTQPAISMTVIQAGILIELIKAQSKPVHRNDLLDKVWEDNGYPASNNSLNHNIGFLRKTLKDYGINDAIITVHRVGFKLNKAVDVNVYHSDATLFVAEGGNEHGVLSSIDDATEIESKARTLLRPKRWLGLGLWQTGQQKKWGLLIAMLLPLLLFVMVIFYQAKPVTKTQHYLATIMGCKTYTVEPVDESQQDKYRFYSEYFLKSQNKHCGPNDILLAYVQDAHDFQKSLRSNDRTFFAICNFDQKKTDSCDSFYSYSMVPQ
ncbi:winged helix-turn-helix domain-containing protein [Pragia fontium]|uniref:winged helix-turn-helix domain-containing protein n=1 Tax=Pragia fontium TaxID=82985 RepID=UPI000F6EFE66|nr:helix-turn-helix domain-containing protein [Pragia fontium]VEJ55017.1 invasion protein regulator [Pragia fontium]